MNKPKITIKLDTTIGILICLAVLLFGSNIYMKYIAFGGLLYLLKT